MNRMAQALLFAILPILPAAGAQQTQPSGSGGAPANTILVVSLADRRMAVVENGAAKKIYRVAVGKPSTPSPIGTFRVISRVSNPTYSHRGKVVLPGPGNPVGTRWIGLSEKGYGIHGTNAPNSIGKAASHGCIRMERRDLEELFAMLKVGATVEIVGEPNAETASLFGAADDGIKGEGAKDGMGKPGPRPDSATAPGVALAQQSAPAVILPVAATAAAGQ